MKKINVVQIFILLSFLLSGCPGPDPASIAISSVKVAPTEAVLGIGESVQLTATIAPEEAKSLPVKWTSSDDGIASVSNGLVTAKTTGSVTITVASANDEKIAASAQITVVASLELDVPSEVELNQGDVKMVNAIDVPEGAAIRWTLNPADEVATVSSTGQTATLTAKAPGTAELQAEAVVADQPVARASLKVTVAGVPETVARGGTLYTLVKAYDFTGGEDDLKFDGTSTITAVVENGLLKVTYPAVKAEGVLNSVITLPESADFIEIKAKLADGTTVASRAFVGLGKGGNAAPAWKTGFIFTDGVGQGTLGSAWGFRSNGDSKPNLTYPNGSLLTNFHTFGIATEGAENFFFDGGNKKSGNDVITTGNVYQFNLGQDNGPSAQGTVYIDYVAFYKAGGYAPDPESTQRIFLDQSVSGTVLRADGTQTEAEYDLMVGNKVFKSVYIDDFSGYNNDINQFWAKTMTIPEELGGTGAPVNVWKESPGNFNVYSGAETVKIKNNELVLSVKKIDTQEGSEDYNQYIAPYLTGNSNRAQQIKDRSNVIVGGLFWNHKWLYGYMEGTIKMVYKYYNVWCGFYTFGRKDTKYGHEIDIYEPHHATQVDQIVHYPSPSGRVGSAYLAWPQVDSTANFHRAAVAWTPDKITFYIDDNETFSLKNGSNSYLVNTTVDKLGDVGLTVVPDTPQDVHLDIASMNNPGYAGGTGLKDPNAGWEEGDGEYDFIYYKSFKVYNYVGELLTE